MTYLLDVNALIGLALTEHQFHNRMGAWLVRLDPGSDTLASCTVSELGFIRIVPLITTPNVSLKEAQTILARVKATSVLPFAFFPDNIGGNQLPHWVREPKQTTDGHLLELAKANNATLATCDQKIPGAFLIPR